MKKKIIIGSMLVILILITISFSTTVSSNTTDTEKKESPLWKIRTKEAISERVEALLQNIKTRFISGDRAIFVPLFENIRNENRLFSVALTIFTCPLFCCKML